MISDGFEGGWLSYYVNLVLLHFMSHHRRIKFIERKAQAAELSTDPRLKLRLLHHCTDWPIALLESSSEVEEAFANRREIAEVSNTMIERYQRERRAQGR